MINSSHFQRKMTIDRGKSLLCNLTNTLVVLIESIIESPAGNKEPVLNEANILLDVLETASQDIGRYDIRIIKGGGGSLLKKIDDFYALVTAFDVTRNENRNRSVLKLFLKAFEPMAEVFAMNWNSELNNPDEDSDSASVPVHLLAEIENVEENTPKKDDEEINRPQTIFEKFSPLSGQVEVINCQLCAATFTNPDSVKNHYRKKHPGTPAPAVRSRTGTCKLKSKNNPSERCGGKFSTGQINRHLQVCMTYS